MNDVPICFVEDVLLALNYSFLNNAKLLSNPWRRIAELNFKNRCVLWIRVKFPSGRAYASAQQLSEYGNSPRFPFDSIDVRFVTNVILSCTNYSIGETDPLWSKVSLQQLERLISKRVCKQTEVIDVIDFSRYIPACKNTTLYSRNEIRLHGLVESEDSSGIGRSLLASMPTTNRIKFSSIRGYGEEIERFLERLGSLYRVEVTNCADITPRTVDLLVDKFKLFDPQSVFTLKSTPISLVQLERLIEKGCVNSHVFVADLTLEMRPASIEELITLYDFSKMFSHVEVPEPFVLLARKHVDDDMELVVELRTYWENNEEKAGHVSVWFWQPRPFSYP